MKVFGSLLIIGSILFVLYGFAGMIGVGVSTVFQQQASVTVFLSGIVMFVGGCILFSMGDICKLLKEIADKNNDED